MDYNSNLPGYKTILSDGNLKFTPTVASTGSVLLIGTSAMGPESPVKVTTLSQAEGTFGKADKNFNLVLGFQETLDAGCTDIRLMALDLGEKATVILNATVDTATLVFTARGRGEGYNGITVEVTDEGAELIIDSASMLKPYTLSLGALNLAGLIEAVNEAYLDVVVEMHAGAESTDAANTLVPGNFELVGGSYEYTQADLKIALADAYEQAEDYSVDLVAPLGAYVDNIIEKFGEQLAEFCAKTSINNKTVLGVIAGSPLATYDQTAIGTYVDVIKALTNTYTHDDDGTHVDAGMYLQPVIGEAVFRNGRVGQYTSTMAAAYAGLISALSAQSSTTNKSIAAARSLVYDLSARQLNELSAARFVTFRNKPARGVVVTDGITAAMPGSDYARLTTVRTIALAVIAIRDAADPFIGEAGGIVQRNSLNTAIKSALDKLMRAGALQHYIFTVGASPSEMVRGIYNVGLEIVPVFELRRITTTITLRPEM